MNRILSGSLLIIIFCTVVYFVYHSQRNESGPIRLKEPIKVEDHHEESKISEKSEHGISNEHGNIFGPFDIGQKRLVVTYDYSNSIRGYSLEIKDDAGVSYYNQTYPYSDDSSMDITGVFKLEGKSGVGLIIFYNLGPNAPPCGPEFQIFGMENEVLKPLSESIILCGHFEKSPAGSTNKTLKLLDGDLIKVAVWKDMVGVRVPFKVDFQKMTITPVTEQGIFEIDIPYTLEPINKWELSTITLYHNHDKKSKKASIIANEIHKVEVKNAFANVQLEKVSIYQLEIEITNIWLLMKVNDIEGWINDVNDLHVLGFRFMD